MQWLFCCTIQILFKHVTAMHENFNGRNSFVPQSGMSITASATQIHRTNQNRLGGIELWPAEIAIGLMENPSCAAQRTAAIFASIVRVASF
jgi:hypothetical protein